MRCMLSLRLSGRNSRVCATMGRSSLAEAASPAAVVLRASPSFPDTAVAAKAVRAICARLVLVAGLAHGHCAVPSRLCLSSVLSAAVFFCTMPFPIYPLAVRPSVVPGWARLIASGVICPRWHRPVAEVCRRWWRQWVILPP